MWGIVGMMPTKSCEMCPRKCGADRTGGFGFCGSNDKIKVAKVMLHKWEEPCISLGKGSGAIFFSNCPLKCIFCQNYEISQLGKGKEITKGELIEIIKDLEKRGAENINLVSPTQYADQILEVLKEYKPKVPVVWNTNSYENVENIEKLKGLVDIFLADLKYFDSDISKEYSACVDYFEKSSMAIKKMREITADSFCGEKMMSGLIVRHLVLPGHVTDSKRVFDWIAEVVGENTIVSVMNQYVPCYKAKNHKLLNRKVKQSEYDEVCDYVINLGFENGYFQSQESACEEFIPDFTKFLD